MSVETVNELIRKIETLTADERQAIKDYLLEQEKSDAEAAQAKESEVGAAPDRPDSHRYREMKWIAEHRGEYAGQYVALDGDRLIAHGTDGRAVYTEARRSGVKFPLVTRIEAADETHFWGGWL